MSRGERVAIVIVSWNTRELLEACLSSLRTHPGRLEREVWVVDNGSEDGSAEMVARRFPEVRLLRPDTNLGFARANNLALARTDAAWLVLLNPDTEVRPGALDRAIDTARREGAVVAGRLLNPDGTLQHSAFHFPGILVDLAEALYLHRLLPRAWRARLLLGGYWDHAEEREIDWALGAFLVVPRRAYELVGGVPEEFFLFGEDMEWCWRFRAAGVPVRYEPAAQVVHHGNQSAGRLPSEWRIQRTHEAERRFMEMHHGRWRAALHGKVRRLGYRVRASLLGLLARPEDAATYRHILQALGSGR